MDHDDFFDRSKSARKIVAPKKHRPPPSTLFQNSAKPKKKRHFYSSSDPPSESDLEIIAVSSAGQKSNGNQPRKRIQLTPPPASLGGAYLEKLQALQQKLSPKQTAAGNTGTQCSSSSDCGDKDIAENEFVSSPNKDNPSIQSHSSSEPSIDESIELKFVPNLTDKIERKSIKIKTKSLSTFQMLLAVISKRLSLPDSELILSFKEVKLSAMSSPHALRMSSKDVITVYDAQSWAARQQILKEQRDWLFKGTRSSEEDLKYVVFKISDRVGKDPVKLKAPRNTLISNVIKMYIKKRNLIDSNIVLSFDGDSLNPADTLQELDIEDEDMLEAKHL